MGFLDEMIGNEPLKDLYRDFVKRYEAGHPAEGYSDQEVVDRYREVAHAVPPDQYAQAAQEALAQLSPEERAEFVKMLQERANARGVALPSQVGTDPSDLGRVVTDLHRKPGQLSEILGGAGGPSSGSGPSALTNILASPVAKAAMAGIAAMIARRVMHGPAR